MLCYVNSQRGSVTAVKSAGKYVVHLFSQCQAAHLQLPSLCLPLPSVQMEGRLWQQGKSSDECTKLLFGPVYAVLCGSLRLIKTVTFYTKMFPLLSANARVSALSDSTAFCYFVLLALDKPNNIYPIWGSSTVNVSFLQQLCTQFFCTVVSSYPQITSSQMLCRAPPWSSHNPLMSTNEATDSNRLTRAK